MSADSLCWSKVLTSIPSVSMVVGLGVGEKCFAVLNLCHACACLEDFVQRGLGHTGGFGRLVGHGGGGLFDGGFTSKRA